MALKNHASNTLIGCFFLATSLATVLIVSCGKNSGTPTPPPPTTAQQPPAVNGGDSLASQLKMAEGSNWQSDLSWDSQPAYSGDTFLEMTGTFHLRNADGSIPKTVTNVSIAADMPTHGHGTGNRIPLTHSIQGQIGNYRFDHLYFTMTGQWRIKIVATVNGISDAWYTNVNVK